MILTVLLLAQGASVLETLDERDLCQIITRNVSAYRGQTIGLFTVETAAANCPAKRIQVGFRLSVAEQNRASTVDGFMNTAREGVCSADPTMQAFRRRGWKFEYTFLRPDGSKDVRTLTC